LPFATTEVYVADSMAHRTSPPRVVGAIEVALGEVMAAMIVSE
jgi:hypothetical protein